MLGLTESTVSHHLTQLRRAGLVESERRGMNVYHRPHRDAVGACVRSSTRTAAPDQRSQRIVADGPGVGAAVLRPARALRAARSVVSFLLRAIIYTGRLAGHRAAVVTGAVETPEPAVLGCPRVRRPTAG